MSTFKTVAELVPCKEICHIYVQIIHLWKNYIAADRYTIELVLCDAFVRYTPSYTLVYQ